MLNEIHASVTEEQKSLVKELIEQLELKGFHISNDPKTGRILFQKELKVVHVPVDVLKRRQWADVRHLFRGTLGEGPQLNNYGSPNDWSRT